ncbi:nose resistant to fluoxetine protein 6-like [Drosophila sulfurigaster albostrigata]|uniref:nose resistant to fluoxetine protein 6-like n=1 Tax=Drosophila sulfurigaster albostrigata TaxID=89887 RepID=UPI002D21DE80|nr:nose resistant to fluoxetine protein 6-like [Drosophila sulfurigaster albostrigata]
MLKLLLLLPVLAQALDSSFATSSLLEGLTQLMLSPSSNQTTRCGQELLALHAAWQRHEAWALKAFDASGSGYANILMGDAHFLGSRVTCQAVNQLVLRYYTSKQQHLLDSLAPFGFDYRVAYVNATTRFKLRFLHRPLTLMHIGLCVPQSCERYELEQLLRQTLAVQPLEHQYMELQPQLVYTKQPQFVGRFLESRAFRLLITLFSLVLLLTLLSNVLPKGSSRVLDCFHVPSNWQRLSDSSKEIAVINGLRVVGAISLLILHVTWYSLSVNHTAGTLKAITSLWLHHSYVPGMVEMFFTISGFLTVSNFLSNRPQLQRLAEQPLSSNLIAYLKSLLQRYLRLMPMQIVLMLLVTVAISYYREVSLLHVHVPLDDYCAQDWWQNVLLIQNLFSTHYMCANWTWSLACEMQFHVLAMLLLHLYVHRPKLVRRLVVGILVANLVYTIALVLTMTIQMRFELLSREMNDHFYFNSFVRLQTYAVGAVYAHAHVNGMRDGKTPLDLVFSGRLVKSLAAAAVLWVIWQMQLEANDQNKQLIAAGIIMMRLIISLITLHLILANFSTERCSFVIRWGKQLLQANCFQFLGKLTFTFYLIHPLLIMCFNYGFSYLLPSDFSLWSIISIAYTVIGFAVSTVLTLFLEIPFNRLTHLLMSSLATQQATASKNKDK